MISNNNKYHIYVLFATMYRKLPLSVAYSSQRSASLSSPKTLLLEPSWLELAVPRVTGLSVLKILHLMLPCKFSRFICSFGRKLKKNFHFLQSSYCSQQLEAPSLPQVTAKHSFSSSCNCPIYSSFYPCFVSYSFSHSCPYR